MLSRTADHIYWLGRYVERAETLARALDVQYRLSLLPQPPQSVAAGWLDTLDELGMLPEYRHRHGEVTGELAPRFVACERDAPSSIFGCLRRARDNARAVRGAITSEMWEIVNATWLELRQRGAADVVASDFAGFIEWVKHRAQLLRGVMMGTMLRDDGFAFIRIGMSLERADGTARLLGARLASSSGGGSAGGYYQWSVLLHALSAFENYRKLFRDTVLPERVAELLLLRDADPRSLRCAVGELYEQLRVVANHQSQETERRAGALDAELRFGRAEMLQDGRLRGLLDDCVARLGDLNLRISNDFLVAVERFA